METRNLQFIAESCGGRIVNGDAHLSVTGISTDSRSIQPGNLFLALSGPNFDAHDFLADVYGKGAAAAVIDETRTSPLPQGFSCVAVPSTRRALGEIAAAYRKSIDAELDSYGVRWQSEAATPLLHADDLRPQNEKRRGASLPAALHMIAVAGSNGKTTTKELVASVLRQKFETLASAASFNNDVGVPLTLLQLERKHRAAVLEVGTNHPGELRPLLQMIRPNAGIITSIGREHLEFFGTIDAVLQEEGTLAEILPASSFLLVNGDGYGTDELVRRGQRRVIRVGTGTKNDWQISNVTMSAEGTRFHLSGGEKDFSGEYVTRLLGTHQVVNATYAVLVGKELGLSRAEIQHGLASCGGAKMRLQLKQIDDFLVLDDAYNANADSMHAALDTLQTFPCKGRRIAVLGDMAELGDSSTTAHEEIGRRAATGVIDYLVAVGKNSRIMASAARGAGLRQVLELPEVEKAGPAVTEIVRPGDVVLVKASRSTRLERVVDFLTAQFGTKGVVTG